MSNIYLTIQSHFSGAIHCQTTMEDGEWEGQIQT